MPSTGDRSGAALAAAIRVVDCRSPAPWFSPFRPTPSTDVPAVIGTLSGDISTEVVFPKGPFGPFLLLTSGDAGVSRTVIGTNLDGPCRHSGRLITSSNSSECEGASWPSDWATPPPISRPTPPRGRSASTSGSATTGEFCSPIPRTSRQSARPSASYIAKIKPEFDKRNAKVISLSVDSVESHEKWASDIAGRKAPMNYPMIGDPDKKVADLYDMVHPGNKRHGHRAHPFHHWSRQEGEAHNHLPRSRWPQLRRDLRVSTRCGSRRGTASRRRSTGRTAKT